MVKLKGRKKRIREVEVRIYGGVGIVTKKPEGVSVVLIEHDVFTDRTSSWITPSYGKIDSQISDY